MVLDKQYKVMFRFSKGTASSKGQNAKINMPKPWLEKIKIENGEIFLTNYDEVKEEIYIYSYDTNKEIELLEKYEFGRKMTTEEVEKIESNMSKALYSRVRRGKVIITSSGGNASKSGRNFKIMLIKPWLDDMGVTCINDKERLIDLHFENNIIRMKKGYVR